MRRLFSVLFFLLLAVPVSADETPIELESLKIDTHDSRSITRGAKVFASHCLLCHSLKYTERDPFAKAAGITAEKMPDKNKNWWFGSAPPDLTLEAKIRGAQWIYNYLHVFYKDPSRPSGSNNLLLPNTNMPNPFIGLQGEQQLIVKKEMLFSESNLFTIKLHYYTVLDLTQKGSLSSDEFDKMTSDLVNFLVYISEPKKFTRERIGIGVLIFLMILFILIHQLKREYWKKIK